MSAGRRVLVTGGADGLGRRIAETFLDAGDRVALLDVNAERLAATEKKLSADGHIVLAYPVDVADAPQVEAAVAAVDEAWDGIDVAVSNAGIAPHQMLLDMDTTDWRRVMAVNLDGTFHVITAVARAMVARDIPGAICCIASGAAFSARPGAAHYCTSKAGVLMLAKALAMESGRDGIRVNVVAPGLIDHGYREGLGEFVPSEYVDRMRENTPLPRLGTGQDVADAVAFLCSDRASFISGAVVPVDGASNAGKFNLPWS